MDRRELLHGLGAAAAFRAASPMSSNADDAATVYELRTYHLNDGKEAVILERFRKEAPVFERSGMHAVGYWVPTEEPMAGKALVYMLRHTSREDARVSWKKFLADPDFLKAKAESESQGLVVSKTESTFLKLADFSPKP